MADETIKGFCDALSKVQAELENPKKNSRSYDFSYADLPSILAHVRPILAKHGMSIVQAPTRAEPGSVGLKTTLYHKDGHSIEEAFELPIPTLGGKKSQAQCAGAAITYARRYALAAMLGVSQSDDIDAEEYNRPPGTQKPSKPKPPPKPPQGKPVDAMQAVESAFADAQTVASGTYEDQLATIRRLAIETGSDLDAIWGHYKVSPDAEFPAEHIQDCIGLLMKKKRKTEKLS